jgi:hypothetical protein
MTTPDPTSIRPLFAVGSRVLQAAVAVALLALASAAAAEQTGTEPAPPRGRRDAQCPPLIAVEERAAEVPEGWTVHKRKTGHRVLGVTFYDGPPSEDASLVYDETTTNGDDWIATWKFAPSERGYWILCRYEATTIELMRALPPTVSVCRVVYDKRIVTDPRHDEVRRIECE